MKTLIKAAKILFPNSKYHNKSCNVLVENGKILAISEQTINADAQVIESANLKLSPGWVDLRADFADPGYEHRETLETGATAAAKGGFTQVQILPNTQPALDSKSHIEYIKQKTTTLPVNIIPAGAISSHLKGEDISEMYDMYMSGVKAFTDGNQSLRNPDLVRRAMLYSSTFDGRIMLFANDEQIAHDGVMHEGEVSTSLGLKGSPSLAETIQISRDLHLAEYCNSPVHFSCISSKESVEHIRNAKQKGISVTCDVAVANLVYTDEQLKDFDTNFKVLPHLRTESDRQALISGINDGTIDAVVSNHSPWNIEEKDCEFDHASFGMSTIEWVFPMLKTALNQAVTDEKLVDVLAINPRKLLGLPQLEFEVGKEANFTLFDSSGETECMNFTSKSKNHPDAGKTLSGKVIGIVV